MAKKYKLEISAIHVNHNFNADSVDWANHCEYFCKKLGSYLLSEAIKISFALGSQRVWVHTCSLDHKNALNNYIARGMKIFKTETIKI